MQLQKRREEYRQGHSTGSTASLIILVVGPNAHPISPLNRAERTKLYPYLAELMHAVEAAAGGSGGTGFCSEGMTEGHHLDRQLSLTQNLIHVDPRQRHLSCARKTEGRILYAVYLQSSSHQTLMTRLISGATSTLRSQMEKCVALSHTLVGHRSCGAMS